MAQSELAFTPEESSAIMRHMNGDHAADSVLMCRALAGLALADSATVVGVDKEGIDFAAIVEGTPVAARILWGRHLADRAEVRGEVVRLYQEACRLLDIEPRRADTATH